MFPIEELKAKLKETYLSVMVDTVTNNCCVYIDSIDIYELDGNTFIDLHGVYEPNRLSDHRDYKKFKLFFNNNVSVDYVCGMFDQLVQSEIIKSMKGTKQ